MPIQNGQTGGQRDKHHGNSATIRSKQNEKITRRRSKEKEEENMILVMMQ